MSTRPRPGCRNRTQPVRQFDRSSAAPLLLVMSIACASSPSGSSGAQSTTVAPPPRSPPPALAGTSVGLDCAERESLARAAQDLEEANALIERTGEHPTEKQFARILSLLRRAAYAGDLAAQQRFGYYVVGYFYTDELFWPRDPGVAVPALAMLRVAARRQAAAKDPLLVALAHDPVVFTDPEGPPALPDAWLDAALKEARRWEDCARGAPSR